MRGLVSVVLAFIVSAAAPASAARFEVVESNDSFIRIAFTLGEPSLVETEFDGEAFFEVEGAEAGRVAVGGAPDLPKYGRLIAIPPGTTPSLSILEVETSSRRGQAQPFPLEHVEPATDDSPIATPVAERRVEHAVYDGGLFPTEWVTLGSVGRVMNHAVLPIRVTPIRQRGGASPSLLVAERIVVEVAFSPRRAEEGVRWVRPREDAADEAIYEQLLLNHESARPWRKRKATAVAPSLRRSNRLGGNGELQIDVRDVGLRRVDFSTVASAGWSATPIENVVLTTRDYDASALDVAGDPFVRTQIAIHLVDADTDGLFDGNDYFLFYGQDARTQRGWTEPRDRYTWDNVYWLSDEPGGALEMATRDGSLTPGPVSEPTDFLSTRRYEENNHYFNYSFHDDDNAGLRQTVDHLFMTNGVFPVSLTHREPFDIFDPAAGSELELKVVWQNVDALFSARFTPKIAIGAGAAGQTIPGNYTLVGNRRRLLDLTLDASYIGSGRHELVVEVDEQQDRLALDWFEIGYRRRYVANDGMLDFDNGGESGRVRYTVTDFESNDQLVLDLTDADVPVRITGGDVSGGGSSFDLAFEDDVSGTQRYLAADAATVVPVPAADVALDTPSSIGDLSPANPAINADILVVVYDDFAAAMDPWVAHRESQGYVVEVVKIGDVYDEFSGGIFNPEAIREYVRYAYRLRPGAGGKQPGFLLLVGDASESYWGIGSNPGPNLVPTYMAVGNVSDQGGDSQPFVSSDHWFISNPDGNDGNNPYFSSMMVGRLPTGSVSETEIVVDKIVKYEQRFRDDPESQLWRNRGLFLADDYYSGSGVGFGAGSYGCRGLETAFDRTSRAAMDTVRSTKFKDFALERFFLSEELDSVPVMGRGPGCVTPTCGWQCSRRNVRNVLDLDGKFIDRASRGHLFVTYQGHGNRSLIAHEWILMGNGFVLGPPGVPDGTVADAERFTNVGKPAVWFFFACHVGEFVKQNEGDPATGDCLAERLLFEPDAGAIATIASTGFEWLTANDPVHKMVFSSWFSRPDVADPISGERRVLLGEVMLGAKNLLAGLGGETNEGMVESYVTLGDPTLRIDIAPPRFQVWQDRGDRPWESDDAPEPFVNGAAIRATDEERDDAFFAARIFDEVPISADSISVGFRVDGATTWVDPADYQLTPGPPDPIGLIRDYELHYTAPLTATDFDLVFRAIDDNARVMDLVLEARTSVRFFEVDDAGQARELTSGSFIDGTRGRLRARIETPVAIPPDDLAMTVNDVAVTAVDATPGAGARGKSGRSFVWLLDATIPPDLFSEGANTIRVGWGAGGDPNTSASIQLSSIADFTVDRVFVFPNPFEDEAGIFYRSSVAARKATVKIYTLSGKLIRVLEQALPRPDINEIEWDGRDDDGDPVANGVYFYRLEITSPDGGTSTEQGKIARVRGHSVD